MLSYWSADSAWRGVLSQLRASGAAVPAVASPSSPSAGVETVEVVAHSFRLANPRARFIESAARPINVAFPLGAVINLLDGRDDVATTDYYNPAAALFSDDGASLRGAYGPRIADQVGVCVDLLRRDPATRRAVLTIFSSELDLGSESRDVPCPLSVQFLSRGGRLHAIATFRSQNAATVFPYDVAILTLLHEYVAAQVGLGLGYYVQHTGSMHHYGAGARVDESALAAVALAERSASWSMPPMESLSPDQWKILVEYEAHAREIVAVSGSARLAPDVLRLPPWWRAACLVLEAFAHVRGRGERHLRDRGVIEAAFA